MSAIAHALQTVMFTIPPQVINKVFIPKDLYGYPSISVEQSILSTVIYPRVVRDANIMGGQLMSLPVSQSVNRSLINNTAIYQYDHIALHDTEIVSVLGFTYGSSTNPVTAASAMLGAGTYSECCVDGVQCDNMGPGPGGELRSAIDTLGQAVSTNPMGMPTHNRTRLVGKNLISVLDTQQMPTDGWFRVIVSHDSELNDIQPRYYIAFSDMVVHAVKSYIYNELVITAGTAALQYGQELSAFSAVVQEYADEEGDYITAINGWQKLAHLNDPRRMAHHIASQINPLAF